MLGRSPREEALALAAKGREESVAALAALVRIPSLTGEEGKAQAHLVERLKDLGAKPPGYDSGGDQRHDPEYPPTQRAANLGDEDGENA